jgi:hypothetical protein
MVSRSTTSALGSKVLATGVSMLLCPKLAKALGS